MSPDLFIALISYAFVTSVTPGPNNFMLLASGVNFGLVRTIPHALGISAGFFSLLAACGLGLGALLTAFPSLHTALKFAGGAYMLYLAWRIASARSLGEGREANARPMTLLEAAAFQWVNPKAWVMAIGALTTYLPAGFKVLDVAMLAAVFGLIGIFCVGAWASFGVAMRQVLQDARSVRIFNVVMALALVASLYPILQGAN